MSLYIRILISQLEKGGIVNEDPYILYKEAKKLQGSQFSL